MKVSHIAIAFTLLTGYEAAFAGCSYLADGCDRGICIHISDQGCEKEQLIITEFKYKATTNTHGELLPFFPVVGTKVEVPFGEQCSRLSDGLGFQCKSGGNTILAGRTYKVVTRGKVHCSDINTGKPISFPGKSFLCTKGCSDISPLRYIDANEEACH